MAKNLARIFLISNCFGLEAKKKYCITNALKTFLRAVVGNNLNILTFYGDLSFQ